MAPAALQRRWLSGDSLLGFQATAIRLQELHLVPKQAVREVFRTVVSPAEEDILTDPKPAQSGGGINAAAGRKLAEVGLFACYTASVALEKKIIDDTDVAEGLKISIGLQPHVLDMARRRLPVGEA